MAATMDIAKMKIADLKKELKERGLLVSGNKSELQERLRISFIEAADADLLADVSADVDDDDVAALEDEILDETESTTILNEDALTTDDVLENLEASLVEAGITATHAAPKCPKLIIRKSRPAVVEVSETSTGSVPETKKPEHKETPAKPLTESEKILERAKKFGAQSEVSKKQLRAARFNTGEETENTTTTITTSTDTTTKTADVDVLMKRAERFGMVSPKVAKLDEENRKTKRQERFGLQATNTADVLPDKKVSKVDNDLKIQKRQERFGLKDSVSGGAPTDVTDRKRKRAERFGLVNAPGSENVPVAAKGLVNAPLATDVDEKKKKRAERFGMA